ncbi:hypothetical protein [Paraflavitalea speifideaquila]|uniref:hypothetical protein n=1 Tax=Paraflavitalea speifideaquila TaxID=3076558 RepID=UPI0028E651F5|nr:hypothetical protein [Paraflavitalea speifideiaquila]
MIRSFSIACLATLVLAGCSHQLHKAQNSNSNTGIIWYGYTKDHKYDHPGDLYQLTDSMIRLHGDKLGYLMSTTSYTDFELRLEYRWNMEPAYQRGTGKRTVG